MLNVNKDDEGAQKKLNQILCEATDAVPNSASLWHMRIRHLLVSGQEEEAATLYPKVNRTHIASILLILIYSWTPILELYPLLMTGDGNVRRESITAMENAYLTLAGKGFGQNREYISSCFTGASTHCERDKAYLHRVARHNEK